MTHAMSAPRGAQARLGIQRTRKVQNKGRIRTMSLGRVWALVERKAFLVGGATFGAAFRSVSRGPSRECDPAVP